MDHLIFVSSYESSYSLQTWCCSFTPGVVYRQQTVTHPPGVGMAANRLAGPTIPDICIPSTVSNPIHIMNHSKIITPTKIQNTYTI